MNYYPFHIGDYIAHTAHLDPIEDCAYRRLLDAYYLNEGPLPAEVDKIARQIRMKAHVGDVEQVLREFFVLTDSGWSHARCNDEIAKMQDKQAKARASAEASILARQAKANAQSGKKNPPVNTDAEHPLNERSTNAAANAQTDAELPTPTPTPTPTPVNSVPDGTDAAGVKPGDPPPADPPKPPMEPDEIIFGYGVPLLVNAGSADKAARSFLGGLRKQHGDAAVIDKLRDCIRAKPLQPLEWLAAALPPKAAPGKHAGFQNLNYREGVSADGSLV